MNPLYETMAVSVFERMSLAAATHGAVNLGQGFPDFGWRPEILDAAAKALREGSNQYAPSRGLPALREAVAGHYQRHFVQEMSAADICVTSGATEALAAAIFAVIKPGDEVIVMTPAGIQMDGPRDEVLARLRQRPGTPAAAAVPPPGAAAPAARPPAGASGGTIGVQASATTSPSSHPSIHVPGVIRVPGAVKPAQVTVKTPAAPTTPTAA